MKYYADKNGKFLGATNSGIAPVGSEFITDKKPKSAELFYDAVNDAWVDEIE